MLTLLVALASGAVGYWLGRSEPPPRRRLSSSDSAPQEAPHDDKAVQRLIDKADTDPPHVVRMRFVHINDVYIMDNLSVAKRS